MLLYYEFTLPMHTRSPTQLLPLMIILIAAVVASVTTMGPISASVFGGAGHSLRSGFQFASAKLSGSGIIVGASLREVVLSVMLIVLDFVLLFATASVIVAGLYLIFSNGDEGQKDKAKKIILYTLFGIIIIIFSRVMVVFVSNFFFS